MYVKVSLLGREVTNYGITGEFGQLTTRNVLKRIRPWINYLRDNYTKEALIADLTYSTTVETLFNRKNKNIGMRNNAQGSMMPLGTP